MALNLLLRSEKGTELTAADHDTNFTAIETEVNAKQNASALKALAFLDTITNSTYLEDRCVSPVKLFAADQQYCMLMRVSAGSGTWGQVVTSANWLALMQSADYEAMRANLKVDLGMSMFADSGTWFGNAAHTLAATHRNAFIVVNRTTDVTITIPNDDPVVMFPYGTVITFFQAAAGKAVLSYVGNNLDKPADFAAKSRVPGSTISIIRRSLTHWVVTGDMAAA